MVTHFPCRQDNDSNEGITRVTVCPVGAEHEVPGLEHMHSHPGAHTNSQVRVRYPR